MKEKYELKTRLHAQGLASSTMDELAHDARLAHELLERVAFLVRVADQSTAEWRIDSAKGRDFIVCRYSDCSRLKEGIGDPCHSDYIPSENKPELAQYLRELEVAE